MPRSITNAVTDRSRSIGAVRMYTMSTSASGPFVIHIFEPFASHPPAAGSARHDIEPITSDPASASLIASAPTCSPLSRQGSHRACCSGVPLTHRLCTQRFECAA